MTVVSGIAPVGSSEARLAAAGLRSFARISAAWSLTVAEQRAVLGGIAKQTLYNWKQHPERARLTSDHLDRISHVLGIYKALHVLFTRSEQADGWLRRPNDAPPFGGKAAVELLASGRMDDLARVRRYLDAQRGLW